MNEKTFEDGLWLTRIINGKRYWQGAFKTMSEASKYAATQLKEPTWWSVVFVENGIPVLYIRLLENADITDANMPDPIGYGVNL